MIVINFKAYSRGIGKNAETLGRICEKVSEESEEEIIVTPQAVDIHRLKDLSIDVFSQHFESESPGSKTGHDILKGFIEAGISGTLINHSEKRLKPSKIKKAVEMANEKGLTTIVCAQDVDECREYSAFKPDYIAFEPPELIGGNTPVSEAEPEVIREAVKNTAEGVETLTGAGIKSSKDVAKSIELGCKGVLVASGVVKAKNQEKALKGLVEGL